MNICVFGIGYVGLCASVCLAQLGHNIVCIDKDNKKIENLKNNIVPIFEPKLNELILKNKNKLIFKTNLENNEKKFDIFIIATGTPTQKNGEVDLSAIYDVTDEIIKNCKNNSIIINKSTVPIGFNNKLQDYINAKTNLKLDVISNPEFLRQGSAIDDFLNPERIIIGYKSDFALKKVLEMYKALNLKDEQIITTDLNSAEMIKYASNSFLALKISFINEISKLCEKTNADIENVKKGLTSDSRIGKKFLNCGIGFGGSCFPKDTKALVNIANNYDIELKTIKATIEANEAQVDYFINKIINFYNGNIKDKTFILLGLSFKPNTNDLREAPSIKIIDKLTDLNANIIAYDPKAKYDKVKQVNKINDAFNDADCLIIATEWEEFKNIDVELLKKLKDKVIFDGRNIFINRNLKKYGLKYYCIGKNEQQN